MAAASVTARPSATSMPRLFPESRLRMPRTLEVLVEPLDAPRLRQAPVGVEAEGRSRDRMRSPRAGSRATRARFERRRDGFGDVSVVFVTAAAAFSSSRRGGGPPAAIKRAAADAARVLYLLVAHEAGPGTASPRFSTSQPIGRVEGGSYAVLVLRRERRQQRHGSRS